VSSSDDPSGRYPSPLRPGEVLRLVLPAFVASTVVAAAGVVLVLSGQRTVGFVLVVIAAVGGIFWRARVVLRAQQRRLPPEE
jgi:hypothetical protein